MCPNTESINHSTTAQPLDVSQYWQYHTNHNGWGTVCAPILTVPDTAQRLSHQMCPNIDSTRHGTTAEPSPNITTALPPGTDKIETNKSVITTDWLAWIPTVDTVFTVIWTVVFYPPCWWNVEMLLCAIDVTVLEWKAFLVFHFLNHKNICSLRISC